MKRIFEIISHLFWPMNCPVCGRMASALCAGCLSSLLSYQLPRCLSCGKTIPCNLHPKGARIYSSSLYEGAMREVIHRLKYGRYSLLGRQLGCAAAGRFERPDVDVLIPVPLHVGSPRRYNQAEEIALGMGRAWGIKVLNAARWARRTKTRAGLSRKERGELSSDVFEVSEGSSGLRAAIVDDVCTTGITLSRLYESCENAGIHVVCAYAVSHVPD